MPLFGLQRVRRQPFNRHSSSRFYGARLWCWVIRSQIGNGWIAHRSVGLVVSWLFFVGCKFKLNATGGVITFKLGLVKKSFRPEVFLHSGSTPKRTLPGNHFFDAVHVHAGFAQPRRNKIQRRRRTSKFSVRCHIQKIQHLKNFRRVNLPFFPFFLSLPF